jgi:hypothetical protein
MTAPIIKTDKAVVADTAAALRDQASEVTAAADSAAASIIAAAALPVPAGARPSPAMKAAAEAMQALQVSTAETGRSATTTATHLVGWESGLGEIQAAAAKAVEALGSGGGGAAW